MRLAHQPFSPRKVAAVLFAIFMASAVAAPAADLRIVCYNVDADTASESSGTGNVGPGMSTVLQGIGNAVLGDGIAQPIDVLALEELSWVGSGASPTLQTVVNDLNGIYGAGTYAYDPTYDPTDGNDTGNGPSGLIYNTKTVKDLGAVAIGTNGGSGAPRDPMQYKLQPIGGSSSSVFYLYVSHTKSGTTSSDEMRRTVEAQELVASAGTLGSNANFIYSGDFNFNGSTGTNTSYQTLVAAGSGQAHDVANPAGNWTDTSAFQGLLTESATDLLYRDDAQLVSGSVLNGTNGLQLSASSYTAFFNNGSTAIGTSVNSSSNTAFPTLPNRAAVLSGLTTVTDHLPLVADYQFATVATIGLSGATSATIITGGTATLGATLTNSAAAGSNNLDYTLSAAVLGGSAALGNPSPGSGTLAAGSSQPFTVAATSTLLGSSTITLTASDPNASNNPQTINATLTVLDHAAGTAAVTAGDGFLVRAGATGLTATISVVNAAGARSGLQIGAAPSIGGGTLGGGPAVPYLVSAGSAQTYMATFGIGNTAGTFSDMVTFASAGDNQSLPGASAPGSLSVSITGNVYSGNAVWTGPAASWATGGNWRDASGGPTNPPGGDGVLGHDTATFASSGAATAIDLTGANPNLQALSFSSSDYTLSNGSLTLQSTTGTATVTVNSNKQTIAGSTVLTLASPADVVVAAGAELDINAGIGQAGGPQSLQKDGGGTLVLSGTNTFDGGALVEAGALVVNNSAALADASNVTVGNSSLFGVVIASGASAAGELPGSGTSAVPVPEPGTIALLAMGAALLAAAAARRVTSARSRRPTDGIGG
jgi:autotransporter-associated beta strand protein